MLTALYYPHIQIDNPSLVKNALLLWDRLEYITPWQHEPRHDDPHLDAALKLIAAPYVPSNQEKSLAHEAIVELAGSKLPEWFFFDAVNEKLRYQIYVGKFLPETWQALESKKLASLGEKHKQSVVTAASFGLTMMSILADCCAGTQKQAVTDEVDSYSALARYLTAVGGGEYKDVGSQYERLVTISLRVIDPDAFGIEQLIKMRKVEQTSKGSHLRSLRHRYLEKVYSYANRLVNEARHDADRKEIERAFEEEMTDDLNALRTELGIEAKKALLSKEMAVAAIAAAGAFVEPISSSVISVGALLKKKVEYTAARNKSLEGHAMSWLYASRRFRLW